MTDLLIFADITFDKCVLFFIYKGGGTGYDKTPDNLNKVEGRYGMNFIAVIAMNEAIFRAVITRYIAIFKAVIARYEAISGLNA